MQATLTRAQLLVRAQRRISDQRYQAGLRTVETHLAERRRMARSDLFTAAVLVMLITPIAALIL
ncbi:hypothetical protein [Burkholderia pseudomallei]|uniref:hypothetical protein n=1 Tax=Burkholderia pseudomallei TaxID=28450 RepID=UPI00193D846E|nr:hypothetical protein [Burkholderia pseudomallei]QRM23531.1 hypothetical protein JQX71_04400 [Burkholderia pseudomallei]